MRLGDEVAGLLRERIYAGDYALGAPLRQEELAEDLQVSRTPLREAIRVLESMGLVASRRRVGITIQPRHHWNVFDPRVIRWRLDGGDRTEQLLSLSELRRGIEPVAASLAAQRANPHHCRILAAAVSDMVVHGRDGDLAAYLLGAGARDPRLEDLAREFLGMQLMGSDQLLGTGRNVRPLPWARTCTSHARSR